MLSASICVGFILPGIIDEPGSFAGNSNSPIPDLGPDDKNLKSFNILINATARVFKLFEKLTSSFSCASFMHYLRT